MLANRKRGVSMFTNYVPTSRLPAATKGQDSVCLVLPFKDWASADIVRTELNDLSQKIHKTIQPVLVSQINQHLKLCEPKPPLVNQQTLVYQFKCDLCDAGYVDFTQRYFNQHMDKQCTVWFNLCESF